LDDDDGGDGGVEMTRLELAAARALFGWSCPSTWRHVSRLAHMVAVDPFFDLVAMSCIVTNIVFLALDHADIDHQMALALNVGNDVRLSLSLSVSRIALILLYSPVGLKCDVCYSAFTLERKSHDASSDLSSDTRLSVKALGHMCGDKVDVSPASCIFSTCNDVTQSHCALTCV